MNIPYIEQLESLSDLLDLLGNKNELGKRLKALSETEQLVNARLKRWEGLEKVEVLQGKAQAMMAEAQEARKQANDYALAVRAKADEDSKANMDKLKVQHQNLNKRTNDLSKREDELTAKEKDLVVREDVCIQDMNAAAKVEEYARALMAEAQAMKKDYDERLAKIRGIAA